MLFSGQGRACYLQCWWELDQIRKNTLSVGVLGSSINHGLSDELSCLLVKKKEHAALPLLQWRKE